MTPDAITSAVAAAVEAERSRALTIMALPGAALAPRLTQECVRSGLPVESADRLLATAQAAAEGSQAASAASGWAKAFGAHRPRPGDPGSDWPGDDVPDLDDTTDARAQGGAA